VGEKLNYRRAYGTPILWGKMAFKGKAMRRIDQDILRAGMVVNNNRNDEGVN
jgi:hypothetical protein